MVGHLIERALQLEFAQAAGQPHFSSFHILDLSTHTEGSTLGNNSVIADCPDQAIVDGADLQPLSAIMFNYQVKWDKPLLTIIVSQHWLAFNFD
jgi:hypothetical protein